MKTKLNIITLEKFIFIIMTLFVLSINIAFSNELLMLTSEVNPGMKGIGKTVFHGTEIETFQVDIIDIVKGESGIANFILAYLSGDKIENSGGISEGMSGSPVYINGKLIGAISYAWEMSEHNLCLITPIQDMLKILNYPVNYDQSLYQEYKINKPICFNGKEINEIKVSHKTDNDYLSPEINQNEIVFYPIASSVTISGLKGRTFDQLSNSLKKFNLKPIQGVYGLEKMDLQKVGENIFNRIEPGSAIGVQLTRGDVNITSIGTVTYREGNKILALGHPFLKKGEVSLFLSTVYIYHSLPSIIMPFKLGSPLSLVGKIVQDREAGILGIINSYPRVIPLKVNVININSNITYQMGVQLIENYDLLESLVSTITVQAVDNALDMIGAGTAYVSIDIRGSKKGQELCRENMYYSPNDIAFQAITEIPEIIDLTINNCFENINLTSITIDIRIDNNKKIGKIEEVTLEKSSLKPGDYLNAKIKIRPFREDLIEKILTIQLPTHISYGESLLIITGGGSDSGNQQEDQFYTDSSEGIQILGLEGVFKEIIEKPRGNQIIGKVITYADEFISQENTDEGHVKKNTEKKDLLTAKIETDMVIEGFLEIPFTILKD